MKTYKVCVFAKNAEEAERTMGDYSASVIEDRYHAVDSSLLTAGARELE